MTSAKPSEAEEEYFARLDFEKRKKAAEKKRSKMQAEEVQEIQRTHKMRCAGCGFELETMVFKGLSIHKCFHCGGAFLTQETFERLCGEDKNFLNQVMEIFQFKS